MNNLKLDSEGWPIRPPHKCPDCEPTKTDVNRELLEALRFLPPLLQEGSCLKDHVLSVIAKAEKMLILLVLFAGIAHATVTVNWSDYCGIPAGFFLNPSIGMPRTDCNYPLGEAAVFQKIKDGYLLRTSGNMGEREAGVMFLRTPAALPEGMEFNGTAHVRWIGTYEYKGIDGYKKTVWAFEPVEVNQ